MVNAFWSEIITELEVINDDIDAEVYTRKGKLEGKERKEFTDKLIKMIHEKEIIEPMGIKIEQN
ncbi:hypothetical protein JZK55_10900 [Dissulfurispira thermophila]|uniref:Uncharacterized protein n=1 Tax=Dissulfurispira thermophila TaxID=2715679 RepID=A0A7G1H0S1_9BACT|nr:hypothetical protein [Dissulfurispira thermophila]BCB96168.1 hypothetical protein JZK55_10900 [Dissulfurispira thermophila]